VLVPSFTNVQVQGEPKYQAIVLFTLDAQSCVTMKRRSSVDVVLLEGAIGSITGRGNLCRAHRPF
jgi:hypothetical protein